MKRILFVVALALAGAIVHAQQFSVARTGGGLSVSASEKTSETVVVDGKSFALYRKASGAAYVVAIGKESGNEYPVWVGEATKQQFEGRTVRVSKSGRYFVLRLSQSGYPRAQWLESK